MKESVTKEIVLKIKNYKNDERYSHLTQEELALLCGTSRTTVCRVIRGEYDHLLSEVSIIKEDSTTVIPYETLKHLVNCELVVNAILTATKLNEANNEVLFIHSNTVHGILRAYLPEEVNNRLNSLREEENNE